MAKYLNLSVNEIDELTALGKALSSPVRINIMKELYKNSRNVNEIAAELNIPTSSAALHIKVLEEAGLINTEQQPGTRGKMKLCSRKKDFITIRLREDDRMINQTQSISMPIGAYTNCEVYPTCGIASRKSIIGNDDLPLSFYLPERIDAEMLWSSSGFVEYLFPNMLLRDKELLGVSVALEICSEAPNYREDWKSEITLWLNEVPCGKWMSPGDFGAERGVLNPPWWPNSSTQHGLLTTWSVTGQGAFVNNQLVADVGLDALRLSETDFIRIRIGNSPDSEYIGGFNIFGKSFGNCAQDIVLTLKYA